MKYEIKRITYEDIDDYMRVNTNAWIESYKEIIDDAFLKKIENEIDTNIKRLKHKFDKEKYRYLLICNGIPVGNTSIGKSRIKDYPTSGEIESLYLLNIAKGKGLGRILLEHDVNVLKQLGYKSMVISCLKDNKQANEFYQHMGGVLTNTRIINIGNQSLEENIYYFKEI